MGHYLDKEVFFVNELFYQMIFKRKSFHLFRNTGNEKISLSLLEDIKNQFKIFKRLDPEIKVDIKIVLPEETTCKRGEEYCILLYSEKKGNYLQNIGYIGEQLDLYLTSLNIGTLWYGFGKTNFMNYHNLDFVMMIAIKKVEESLFRKDMFKSKRKSLAEIWHGEYYLGIANIVRFAPSSCNAQPWIVESMSNKLKVYRYKEPGKRGMMPLERVTYSNRIDIGIFLLFLEVCLKHENLSFKKEVFLDTSNDDEVKTLVAIYNLRGE